MSRKCRTFKAIKKVFIQISKQFLSAIKKQIIWLLRIFVVTGKKRSSVNAGFVLPTVAMVALVVVLLTTAILFRSFERSKNASNVRVNEAALNAATPAIDRARAKLNKLFQDGRLPRATPTDDALYSTLTTIPNINEYTFGDETQLQLTQGSDNLKTAWLYPVDTDNNGKFDSYTLYGIYFRNPPISDGAYTRARNSLEARTPPMTAGSVSGDCGDTLGTSATLVGETGWFNIGGKLKKSFFVYTANVPITTDPPSAQAANYEKYKGNKGFSALEYQQERVQLPLVNNAVIYEDDIGLSPGPAFRLNGRIFTNSNFLTASPGNSANLYQVSSLASCFYTADNGKITVGGNLGAGGFTDASDLGNATNVHLYQGKSIDPSSSPPNITANKSVAAGPSAIAYNSLAYVQRLNRLVSAQTTLDSTGSTDPQEVKDGIIKQQQNTPGYTTDDTALFRQQELYNYFKRRTRRVPYAEVGFGGDALTPYATTSPLEGSGDTLRPKDVWIYPFQYSTTPTTSTTTPNPDATLGLPLHLNGSTKVYPTATEPTKQLNTLAGNEQSLGDRVLVGNNLPELWWNGTAFVGPNTQDTQAISDKIWDDGTPPSPAPNVRTRRTQVQQLADFGATDRDKDWELAAAKIPTSPQDPSGGLRVITGAGIYLPSGYTTTGIAGDTDFSNATTTTKDIWSDMMPVASGNATEPTSSLYPYITLPDPTYTPYLRMRASVVYHYNKTSYSQSAPQPIACVSSYYDPTSSTTARNKAGLPDVFPVGVITPNPTTNVTAANAGNSNNGVVYSPPDAAGETTYAAALRYQAQLKYPNGRLVNPILNSLYTQPITSASTIQPVANRTLSERSAVESAVCALQILDGTIGSPTDTDIPHGAIMETAFLDPRQVKAIHADVTMGVETFTNADGNGTVNAAVPDAANYNLSKEQRQPLEIRATVLDIDKLRGKTISGGSATVTEYLLPNSGIIYATRDDALLDLSALKLSSGTNAQKKQDQNTRSPVDFILDPTRRPNAIMLNNGGKVWRTNSYRDTEKGLILASNLPVYVKGNFNLHTEQEFTTALADDWGNFYTRTAATRNVNFACRSGDPRLPNCATGDEWRPASVLADAVTLLSNNFRLGFRNEGDYDLNNNLGNSNSINKFTNNGFFANAYVTNFDWSNSGVPRDLEPTITIQSQTFQGSSYLNNFVTPIQRRINAPEYLMEVCPKLPVSECDPAKDWYVHYIDSVTPANNRRSWLLGGTDNVPNIALDGTLDKSSSNTNAGTTVTAFPSTQMYPRRVAFKRDDTTGALALDGGQPVILGIKDGKVNAYPLSAFSSAATRPDLQNNALWFRTTTANNNDTPPRLTETVASGTINNPRLIPVLQVQNPTNDDNEDNTEIINTGSTRNWLQIATETTFNLAAAAGDTPARPTEDNGGLHNFVRFIENWNPTSGVANAVKARINGSFIQFKRSAYATGPFRASLAASFYPITGNNGTAPFYIAPTRQWGYDVGLLSQSPDLFAQKLVRTPDDLPDEYFREVGRDDAWVKTLLCAKKADDTYAIDEDQRRCD
ncbi:hormogonium polysaccharide biosynthesis protein HpsA [Nostoc sp. MG11]|uniref:hormogonium polysaccharide biosynthesis protein HpsA n=1 Tax=Nostoc sp. MG11 TaxID=2721166 RepID=UPI001867EB12|nr:hormogonium polysaccharide biosynthesis protein HpsA [Nostoc sp. MG11]